MEERKKKITSFATWMANNFIEMKAKSHDPLMIMTNMETSLN